MKYFFYCTFLLFSIVGCSSKQEQQTSTVQSKIVSVKDTLPNVLESNDSIFQERNFELHKVFVSKNSPLFMAGLDSLVQGFTFVIKKQVGNVWEINNGIEYGRRAFNWIIKDWNHDGYNDVVLRNYFDEDVFLFNPDKNEFVHFGSIGRGEISSIEKSNLLYNFSFKKQVMYNDDVDGYYQIWESELFEIDKNYSKIEYGRIDFHKSYRDINNQEIIDTIPFIHIYKFDSKQFVLKEKIDFRNIKPPLNFEQKEIKGDKEEVDYSNEEDFIKDYWLKNWKAMVKKD
jgi:hypothetical protein